jgi:hypothetical protein
MAEATAPSMWVSGQDRSNVVVLSKDALFVATVRKDDLARIDLGLEDGKQPYELLPAKATQIPLADITRFQFKRVRSKSAFEEWMNKDLTVYYRDQTRERSLKISLDSEAIRDEVAQALNRRVGPWPIAEAAVAPWRILIRYLYIILVLGLLTVFFSWLELSDYWNRHASGGALGNLMNRYFDAFGVWGIFVPGLLACVIALIFGVLQLRNPPIVVTYQSGEPGA